MRTEIRRSPAQTTTDPDAPSDVVRIAIFDTLVGCFRVLNVRRDPADRAAEADVVRLCHSLAFHARREQLDALVVALKRLLDEPIPQAAA
jgi:hypothetical protein